MRYQKNLIDVPVILQLKVDNNNYVGSRTPISTPFLMAVAKTGAILIDGDMDTRQLAKSTWIVVQASITTMMQMHHKLVLANPQN